MPPASRDQPTSLGPRTHAELFWSFTWLALQGFGGVMAVVQRELVERKGWLTREQFIEEWAVAQIMPGPNVVNLSMMLGGRYFGLSGALAALAGMLALPTLLVLAIAVVYSNAADAPVVQRALHGIGAVAAGLILATALKLLAALRANPMGLATCLALVLAAFVATAVLHLPLLAVLGLLGSSACLWALRCLRRAAQAGTPRPPAADAP